MKKWYLSVALLAGWLGQSGLAGAQFIPNPLGAARIPEPLPCGPTEPQPNLVPGPISPHALPSVPECGTDLPADHSSAFQCEEPVRDNNIYFHLGAQGLRRQKLGPAIIAVQDPQALDTGVVPVKALPHEQDLNDIQQFYQYGPRATLGALFQNQAIEVTGFYIFEAINGADRVDAGRIDLPFFNPPLGFEGDNGLWLQADKLRTEFRSSMASAEANYRYTNLAVFETELILGVRYVDEYEKLGIFTDDDGVNFPDINGNPDPLRQATYQVQTHNRIIAPQVGFEVCQAWSQYCTFGFMAKAAVGVDFAQVTSSLSRGDGLVAFNTQRHQTFGPAQIYDLGAYVDINPLEKMRIRFGYNALFLANVATANDQIDFNLANQGTGPIKHGNIFYHGPMVEFQFLF